jgi:hypothetical protein
MLKSGIHHIGEAIDIQLSSKIQLVANVSEKFSSLATDTWLLHSKTGRGVGSADRIITNKTSARKIALEISCAIWISLFLKKKEVHISYANESTCFLHLHLQPKTFNSK